jgi:hypothetical protein
MQRVRFAFAAFLLGFETIGSEFQTKNSVYTMR